MEETIDVLEADLVENTNGTEPKQIPVAATKPEPAPKLDDFERTYWLKIIRHHRSVVSAKEQADIAFNESVQNVNGFLSALRAKYDMGGVSFNMETASFEP